MGWKDSLRKASWRGAEFFWTDANTTFDPMVVVHKYPQRRGGWSEDLGLGPDEFEVVGYVLGADYMAARDTLIKAIKEGGPGTLVHPTMGEKTVVLKPPARIQESTREGGMARFTLVFVEEGENKYPTETAISATAAAEAVEAAQAAIADDFGRNFDTGGLDLLESDAARALLDVAGVISESMGALRHVMRTVEGVILTTSAIGAGPMDLVRDARSLAARLAALFGGLASGDSGTASSSLSALSLISAGIGAIKTTSASARQDTNRAALDLLVRRQAAIGAAAVAASAGYASRDDAIKARDHAVKLLDAARIDDGATGTVFGALTDLRAATVRALTEKAGTLASVRLVEMAESMPAVLLAYRELGDATRADELVARNRARIWHPLFVPAGATIEVLND